MNKKPKIQNKKTFSMVEILLAVLLLALGLIPILTSMANDQRGTAHTEDRFLGEQYALELASLLDVLTPQSIPALKSQLDSGAGPLIAPLSPLDPGFSRTISFEAKTVSENINGSTRTIKFLAVKIEILIPGMKGGVSLPFRIGKVVRDRVF